MLKPPRAEILLVSLAPGSEVIRGFVLLWLPWLLVADDSSAVLNHC